MVRIRNSELDAWGVPITADHSSSVAAWNHALNELLALRGDPIGELTTAIEHDPTFALGRVVRIATAVLGGTPLDHPTVVADLDELNKSTGETGDRERAHLVAVRSLVAGDFSEAAAAWEAVVDAWPRDLAAIRLAHDLYLHVGDDRARLVSSRRAIGAFDAGEPVHGIVLGQLAFAHEEVGDYDTALVLANRALAVDPGDVWARHAAAHVHEMRGDSDALYALLDPNGDWPASDLLAAHLWWHRGIRLVAEERVDEALDVADLLPAEPDAAFTLADLTSLLIRLEARGVDLGARWERVIDAWKQVSARHTCGYLDLHAALAGLADPAFGAAWHASQIDTIRRRTGGGDVAERRTVPPGRRATHLGRARPPRCGPVGSGGATDHLGRWHHSHWRVAGATPGHRHRRRHRCRPGALDPGELDPGDQSMTTFDLADPSLYDNGIPHDVFSTLRKTPGLSWNPDSPQGRGLLVGDEARRSRRRLPRHRDLFIRARPHPDLRHRRRCAGETSVDDRPRSADAHASSSTGQRGLHAPPREQLPRRQRSDGSWPRSTRSKPTVAAIG